MARMRQPDDYYAQEEALLFNSLCLLDAPNAEGGKLLEFSRGMFRKPNAKALEFLLHFVYSLANGKAAAKKFFKGLWPLLDKDRKQAKEFYQRAQDWLKEAGLLDAHGHSLSPFQRNASGPKLVSFLVDLTDWALRIHHKRLFPQDTVAHSDVQDPALLLTLSEPLLTAARAQNQLQAECLLRACQQGARVQQQAEAAAGSLRDDYYILTAQLAEAQRNRLSTLPQEADSLQQDSSSSTELPPDLQAQQQQLQQLWAALEQHLQACAPLSGLVTSLAGSDVHPYAIDGLKLRADGPEPPPGTSGLAGLLLSSTDAHDSKSSMDVAALVEAWVTDMTTVCRYMHQLAGTDKQQQQQQQHSWGPLMGRGGGASVTPLVASSDAASHAPHLYAQLNLHRSCLEQLKSLKATLAERMAAAAERIQQLDGQVSSLMEADEQRYLLMAAAAGEDYSAADAAGDDVLAWLGGAPSGHGTHHHQQQQQHEGGGLARGNLFADTFQLVPPTPLLQQLVHRQQAGLGAPAGLGLPASSQLQQLLLSDSSGITPPLDHTAAVLRRGPPSPSSSSAAALRPAAGGRADSSPRLMGLCSPASDAGAPDDGAALASPGGSSVSSAALPAAELLMAQDIMDVDLISSSSDDDDGGRDGDGGRGLPLSHRHLALLDGDTDTGGGLSLPQRTAAAAAASPPLQLSVQQAGARARDYSRMRISLELMHGQAGAEQLLAAEDSLGDVSSLGGGGQQLAGQHEQEATSRSGASGGLSFRQPGDERQQASRDTPRLAGQPQPAGAVAAVAAAAAAGAASCASAATDSPDVFAEPLGHQPGSDRLSSARPRRLTFAAAVSAEDSGGAVGSPISSSSSADDEEQHRQAEATTANASAGLESLKQRFANLHKG